MAISNVRSIFTGSGVTTTGDRDYAVTLTAAASVGERVWVFHAVEAGDTTPQNPAMQAFDSKGNTWSTFQTFLRNNVSGGTVAVMGFSTKLTTALAIGDTVTIRSTNTDFGTTRRSTAVIAASGVDDLDVSAVATPASGSSSVTIGPTATTTQADAIVFGLIGSGVQNFTASGGATKIAQTATTEASANRQLTVAYKIVSATGTQSITGTFAASTTWVGAVSVWKATPASNTSEVFLLSAGGVWQSADIDFL